jgi:hypothetical protein
VAPHAGGADRGLLAETVWATLHGLVTLTRSGRLPAEHAAARLAFVVGRLLPDE